MHTLVAFYDIADLYLQVRAESPMEPPAQGKRSDTLGSRVLEQSRPERAKALNVRLGILSYITIQNSTFGFSKRGLKAQ